MRSRAIGVFSIAFLLAGCAAATPAAVGTGPGRGGEGLAGPPAIASSGHVAATPAVSQSASPAVSQSASPAVSQSATPTVGQGVSPGCVSPPYGPNFYSPAFGSGKTVALTFDDGPGPTTPGIIAVLRKYGVPGTFMNIGENAAAYPSLVREEATLGYLVGNHTWNHPDMPTISPAAQAAELDEASAEQESLIGWGPCVFRPPYGDYNSTLLTLAQDRGMAVWLWSVDTQDWEAEGSASSYWVNRIIGLAESEGGALDHPVILMHNAPSGDPATVLALPTIISYFRDHGYTFVNLADDTGSGYYILTSRGVVDSFGAPAPGPAITGQPVGIATDPDTGGYWVLKVNGSVVAYHAPFYGQLSGNLPEGVTPVAIAASRGGYLVLTSDGRVHAFGAPYYGEPSGELGGTKVVGLAVDAATGGYWIADSSGGIWQYDAPAYGSLTGTRVPVTAIAASPQGGYLLLTATGAVYGYHADVYGSVTASMPSGVTAVALATAPATGGYWILASNGQVFQFNAPWQGSLAGHLPALTTATAIAGV